MSKGLRDLPPHSFGTRETLHMGIKNPCGSKVRDNAVTESKLALLTTHQANESERQGVETRKVTLFRKPADQEDGRLAS